MPAGYVVAAARPGRNPSGRFLGAIPVKTLRLPHAFGEPGGASPLVYHGGPVMHSVTTHAIFWAPPGFSFAPGFQAVIEKYLNAISSASGSTSDVYAVARQYFDTSGPIANRLSFGGSITVSDPLPAADCTDPGLPGPCLSGDLLQTEVQRTVDARGLPHGLRDMYFLFTPQGITSCEGPGSNTPCYGGVYCAYHSFTTQDPSNTIIWVNTPSGVLDGCNLFSQEPNGNPADVIINGMSHESVEAMTDPLSTAWFSDESGPNEVGDKCYKVVPPMVGGVPGAEYDQLIGGSGFAIQPEWSNVVGDCAMSLPHAPPWPTFAVSGPPRPGATVGFDASASTPQDGVPIATYRWNFGDGQSAAGPTVSHTFQTGGSHQVTLTVADGSGEQNSYTALLNGGL